MLKNYTSQVPVSTSVSFIEQCLTKNGARQILKEYDATGRCDGICFSIPMNGQEVHFKLPAQIANCERVLFENLSRRAKPETKKQVPKQAERTAWKILSDWVEAQMAMIELAQVEVMEVFMPYDPATKQTFFQMAKANNFHKLLPGGAR
jgi:hypothetical protein